MRLWLRADASATIGLGHLLRCVALAEEAVGRGIDVTFVVADDPLAVAVASRHGYDVMPVPSGDRRWLESVNPDDVVVFDGYGFDTADHAAARSVAARTGAIDDLGSGRLDVDVLVNPSEVPDADDGAADGTVVLTGPRHALVRRAFTAARDDRTGRHPATDRLLLAFGGTDAAGLAPTAVDALAGHCPFEAVTLLRGPGSTPFSRPHDRLDVVEDPPEVASVFAEADAAVAAAGTTTWELLCVGVPTALVTVAGNQRLVARTAIAAGAALDAGEAASLASTLPHVVEQLADPTEQARLAEAGKDLVDGRGAARVLDALLGVGASSSKPA